MPQVNGNTKNIKYTSCLYFKEAIIKNKTKISMASDILNSKISRHTKIMENTKMPIKRL